MLPSSIHRTLALIAASHVPFASSMRCPGTLECSEIPPPRFLDPQKKTAVIMSRALECDKIWPPSVVVVLREMTFLRVLMGEAVDNGHTLRSRPYVIVLNIRTLPASLTAKTGFPGTGKSRAVHCRWGQWGGSPQKSASSNKF